MLIVDDEIFNLTVLTDLLKEFWNITPDQANDGDVAVKMYQQKIKNPCRCEHRAYKLILMDVNMINMDGIQACQKILDTQLENEKFGNEMANIPKSQKQLDIMNSNNVPDDK